MLESLVAFVIGFAAAATLLKIGLGLLRLLGVYTMVEERTARVYVLFGKVVGVIDEPGLHSLWASLGPRGLFVNLLGRCQVVDLRLDQRYLRSLPVNSEEGTPMGIGVWYEMYVSDPVKFMFENADPRGSLEANVRNSTVRCLSNLDLQTMLTDRHSMSRAVRAEISAASSAWGFQSGSIYIRKVHFRDQQMLRQIEEKVVNRLRQVTSAILQDGENQVSVIRSSAERQAAIEFAKARALKPRIIGEALGTICSDQEVAEAMFQLLEIQRLLDSQARLTLVPQLESSELLPQLLAAEQQTGQASLSTTGGAPEQTRGAATSARSGPYRGPAAD